MPEEIGRNLPKSMIKEYMRLLEERGLLRIGDKRADTTPTFRRVFDKAVKSVRTWYTPSIIDEPLVLVAQEMARIILNVTPSRIERGLVKPEEMSRLASVLVEVLRLRLNTRDTKLITLLLQGDDSVKTAIV